MQGLAFVRLTYIKWQELQKPTSRVYTSFIILVTTLDIHNHHSDNSPKVNIGLNGNEIPKDYFYLEGEGMWDISSIINSTAAFNLSTENVNKTELWY